MDFFSKTKHFGGSRWTIRMSWVNLTQKNVTGALGWEKRGFFLRANISEKEHFGQKKNYFWKKDIWSKMLYHMDFLRKFMLSYCKLAQKKGQLRQFKWIMACFLHKHKGTICPQKKFQLKVWHLVQKATSYGLFSKNWVELLQISEKRSIRIGDWHEYRIGFHISIKEQFYLLFQVQEIAMIYKRDEMLWIGK